MKKRRQNCNARDLLLAKVKTLQVPGNTCKRSDREQDNFFLFSTFACEKLSMLKKLHDKNIKAKEK